MSDNSTPIRIIAAHAGTGKTTFAAQNPEKFIDFVLMPYKYHLPDRINEDESESCKADFDLEMRDDYPFNYVEAIKNLLNTTDKMIIIPSTSEVLRLLQNEDISYLLCYPENTEEAKSEYQRRYIERGNNEDFLGIFVDGWNNFMCGFENDDFGVHIVLKSNEFLSDVINTNKEHYK